MAPSREPARAPVRILLADDSPHAQRMGERILREEGFEVVTVTDGLTALVRLPDVDPDIVFADVSLPQRTGYEICREIKNRPRHRHVRVILTAGLLENVDEGEASAARCDGVLRKPFEASAVLETLGPLVTGAQKDRSELGEEALTAPPPIVTPVIRDVVPIDPEQVRAAVTVALDAALPAMIDHVTEQVLVALRRD